MVFTFLSWLDLLGVALAFWISILKIFKSLQNYWHRVTNITSFDKHLESSSGHTPEPIFISRICLGGISHPVFYDDLLYKLRWVKSSANFVSSDSKILKRLRRRKYDPVIIERTIGLVLVPSASVNRSFLDCCTLTNKAQKEIRPWSRLLWLFVETHSAPELSYSFGGA